MKPNTLIPRLWLLISLLFTIHNTAQNTIVGYQYAFNEGEGLQFVTIAPTQDFNLNTSLDVSALTNTVNTLHIRFLDANGLWSSVVSSIFIKPPEVLTANTNIVGYEYGFDDDNPPQFVAISPTTDYNLVTDIDASALTKTVNIFYIRFLDDQGRWSSIISNLFIKPPEVNTANAHIVGYQYGFDDDNPPQFVSVAPTQDFNLIADIDVSALTKNVNMFYIRFLDDQGRWSSVTSSIFIKTPEISNVDASIVGYEYGFDDDNPPQFVPVSPTNDFNLITDIDASGLNKSLNIFYIRFLDDTGKWSSIISQIFIKPPEPLVYTDNKLVAYDYWFDNDTSTKVTTAINPAQTDFILANVDMSQLWAGDHILHTQFKDEHNNYSVVLSDTINKIVLPIANFMPNITSICQGESVDFTNNSIDYDTVSWNFGDGETSADVNPTHTFNTSGTFDVELTVTDSSSGLDSIATQSIQVFSLPLDTVTLSFNPTTLTADQAGATYQWLDCNDGNAPIDGATNQSFSPTADGDYAVEITLNNCTVVSSCTTALSTKNSTLDGLVKLYPNPVNSVLNVKSEIPLQIDIYNLTGIKIQSIKLENGLNTIDLNRFSSGLYIFKITDRSDSGTSRQSIYRILKD